MARILVVDDEPMIVDMLTELLVWEGLEVVTAANGLEALEALAEIVPDLVLLDLMMPLKDGTQTLMELRAQPRLAGVPVVVMTGAPMALPKGLGGFDAILVKPFSLATLRATLTKLLPPTS